MLSVDATIGPRLQGRARRSSAANLDRNASSSPVEFPRALVVATWLWLAAEAGHRDQKRGFLKVVA